MITKEMIRKGVLQSVIQFMPGPNGHDTICRMVIIGFILADKKLRR